ncbi:hypothetical protein J3998_07175 [Thiomicrorhabdus sp. 6S2-11]|uniref:Outer membrane protein beta-barrel domain-containing protein n=1 Tax=Thiomicrorhabdus marina TaxID=2818442 RepID=A0ABS3Q4V2_9GAMM|nr:hypothetical protein [Thiomicrorhabdus marina]MBO1927358.1 hypothetical protein [Thiomicrorhabdus marina]
MKKVIVAISFAAIAASANNSYAQTSPVDKVGVAVGVDLISGPTLELSYPISDYVSVRGSLSTGWSMDEEISDTDITYNVETDGAINRLALDIRPFQGAFFLSAGYGLSNFKVKPSAEYANGDSFTVDGNEYTVTSNTAGLNGNLDWDSAPTVSLNGFGTVEDSTGLVTYDLAQDDNNIISDEEANLQAEADEYDLLPIIRMAATYRF